MAISHHDREEETLIAYFQQMLADVDDEEFSGELHATPGGMVAAPVAHEATEHANNQQVLMSANAAIASAHASGNAAQSASGASQAGSQATIDADGAASSQTATSLSEESSAHKAYDEGAQNPSGGIEHITTHDMLTREMSIADETDEIDNPLAYGLEPEPQVKLQVEHTTAREYAPPENTDSLQRLLASIPTETKTEAKTETTTATKTATATATAPQTQVATQTVPPTTTATQTETATATQTKIANAVAAPQVAVATPQVQVAAPQTATAVATQTATATNTANATTTTTAVKTDPTTTLTKQVVKTHQQLVQEKMDAKLRAINSAWKNVELGQQFQALFFLAQGVRFAVPLIDLGGIFECDKVTQLFGKPSWFMGITDVRGTKINIVDTLRWVMPEIGESPDKYPYLIALGTSPWAIGCDVLEGNRSLSADQVKWREIPGSRPWLAGIVTSDKCALLHVNALISLFDAGANIEDLVREFEEGQKTDKGPKK